MVSDIQEFTETQINGVSCVIIDKPEYFDIGKIFDCGQCFRFDRVISSPHKAEFSGVAEGRFVSFAEDDDKVYIYNSDEEDFLNIWYGFLGLDMNYAEIEENIFDSCQSPVLRKAAEHGRGIRILRQDRFESVISFIISQNNNIPRIKKIIESLCARCGVPVDCRGMESHFSGSSSLCSFPDAEAIYRLGIEGLAELRTGFRAKYIFDCVEKILSGELDLNEVYSEPSTSSAIENLCRVKGIGMKVASCALLFGFERYDAFPIDVWMKRVMAKYFPEYKAENLSSDIFGQYAGIAQQYLFYYERYHGGE